MVELLAGNAQTFGGEMSRSRGNRCPSCFDVMGDGVFRRLIGGLGRGEDRKLGEESLKVVGGYVREKGRAKSSRHGAYTLNT